MPTVADDIKRLNRQIIREGNEEFDRLSSEEQQVNYDKTEPVLIELVKTRVNDYKNELVLAKKAGLLKVTYTNGKFESIIYNMKGIPVESPAKSGQVR